jgi:hypothetical protein
MDFVANDMKFDYFIIKQWGGRFKVQGSRFRVQGSGFRVVVAASPRIYIGRCPKVVFKLQVTSRQSLGTPNP